MTIPSGGEGPPGKPDGGAARLATPVPLTAALWGR